MATSTRRWFVAYEVRELALTTRVAEGGRCYGSCLLIFLAGVQREAVGELGLGQSLAGHPPFASERQSLADAIDALTAFGAPAEVVSMMLRVPDDRVQVLSNDEKALLTTTTADRPPFPPVLLLEARADGEGGATPVAGTISWTQALDAQGRPSLRGRLRIAERGITASIVIERNGDADLPASHVFQIRFYTSTSFAGGRVDHLPGLLFKNQRFVQGRPLIGAAAKVEDSSFLFALSASPTDVAENARLVTSNRMLDVAIVYATGQRAILSIEKDELASEVIAEMFAEVVP